jgi:hypothetical protein
MFLKAVMSQIVIDEIGTPNGLRLRTTLGRSDTWTERHLASGAFWLKVLSNVIAANHFDVASISMTSLSFFDNFRGLMRFFCLARGMQFVRQNQTAHLNKIREGILMNCKQHIVYTVLLLFVLVLANGNALYGQGKLGNVRDAVRQNKPVKSNQKTSHDDHDHVDDRRGRHRGNRPSKCRRHRHNRNRNRDSGWGIVIGSVFSPPVEEVHALHHSPVAVVPAPPQPVYQPVVNPIVEQPTIESDYFVNSAKSFDWGIRLTAVGGTDFDDIAFGSFGLLLQNPSGLGVDTSVKMIRESGMDFRDHLYIGDVNVVYEPIATQNFRVRVGVGINWLGDSYSGDAGFNMTSGFDLRLTDQILATGEVDFGSIGDADITHARLGLGRLVSQNTEWVVGYDHLNIGGVTIGSAFTGLQFRF